MQHSTSEKSRHPCWLCALVTICVISSICSSDSSAQNVQLNLGNEIELRIFVDTVSKQLGVRILYDETLANQRISIRSPGDIPADSLLDVLRSALQMKGFLLVEAGAPGWLKIVKDERLPAVATPGEAGEILKRDGRMAAVTQTFVLEHITAEEADQVIKPFLTQPGANSIPIRNKRILVVSDYASNLVRIAEWLKLIDKKRADAVVRFHQLEHADATDIAQQLSKLLNAQRENADQNAPPVPGRSVDVSANTRTNQLILVGRPSDVEQAISIAKSLDVPTSSITRIYPIQYTQAVRIERFFKALLGVGEDETPIGFQIVVDEEANLLVLTANQKTHQRLADLIERMDKKAIGAKSPIRFYKLKNATAEEVLTTILSLAGRASPILSTRIPNTAGRLRPAGGFFPGGGFVSPGVGAGYGSVNPYASYAPSTNISPIGFNPVDPRFPNQYPGAQQAQFAQPTGGADAASNESSDDAAESEPSTSESISSLLSRAQITADLPTNSIIVVAEPRIQSLVEDLIRKLDERRPQVMIEARVVILNCSDDFVLGVEVSGGDRTGGRRSFGFSSFGFSEIDPATGALTINPGLGLNGVLVDPDVADVILRALTTHRRSRVLSSPRILVNDNATGVLSSVAEVPFTSVNASQTVATTSFAGFAEAGTTITVTPHISDDGHLQLEYKITLNNFTGTGSDGIPPPRQTDELESIVTVPDGHTIVVGGLKRRSQSSEVDAIPFIEKIPIVRHLGSNQAKMGEESSLFVFLRPVILKEDQFADLRFLSGRDAGRACIQGDYPVSSPMTMQTGNLVLP